MASRNPRAEHVMDKGHTLQRCGWLAYSAVFIWARVFGGKRGPSPPSRNPTCQKNKTPAPAPQLKLSSGEILLLQWVSVVFCRMLSAIPTKNWWVFASEYQGRPDRGGVEGIMEGCWCNVVVAAWICVGWCISPRAGTVAMALQAGEYSPYWGNGHHHKRWRIPPLIPSATEPGEHVLQIAAPEEITPF